MEDKVLLFNSRVKLFGHRKLWSKWEGPFKVISTLSHGAITLENDKGTLFKINGHRLKIFLEPKKPPEDLDEVDFIIMPYIYTSALLLMIHSAVVILWD
jgi:hypothetical protein